MNLLVCGSRDWSDSKPVIAVLQKALDEHGENLFVLEGGARGADAMARNWAKSQQVDQHTEKADWRRYGKGAGGIRNQVMLDLLLDLDSRPSKVLAFKDGFDRSLSHGGTEDMCRRAILAQVPTFLYGEGRWVKL